MRVLTQVEDGTSNVEHVSGTEPQLSDAVTLGSQLGIVTGLQWRSVVALLQLAITGTPCTHVLQFVIGVGLLQLVPKLLARRWTVLAPPGPSAANLFQLEH